jgi:hypothetical protein
MDPRTVGRGQRQARDHGSCQRGSAAERILSALTCAIRASEATDDMQNACEEVQ